MGVPQNEWFIVETPIKIEENGGYPLLWTTPYLSVGQLVPCATPSSPVVVLSGALK